MPAWRGIGSGLRVRSASTLAVGLLALAIGSAACSSGGTPAPASAAGSASPSPSAAASTSPVASPSPSAAASTSPVASPSASAAALPACLDKATYDKLRGATASSLEQDAAGLIAGLEAWAPAKAFDAQYRDRVVAKLKAADYAGAALDIGGGLATGQWQIEVC